MYGRLNAGCVPTYERANAVEHLLVGDGRVAEVLLQLGQQLRVALALLTQQIKLLLLVTES